MQALREYLAKQDISQAEFGKRFDPPVTQGAVHQWLKYGIPDERVIEIERATNGEVTRQIMRPHWFQIEAAA